MFQTQYIGGQPVNPIKDTVFTNVTITGAQRSGDGRVEAHWREAMRAAES